MRLVVVAVAILEASQLPRQFARHQINAGVKVLTAFLGANHRAVGEHGHLGCLLWDAGIARHRQMDIRFLRTNKYGRRSRHNIKTETLENITATITANNVNTSPRSNQEIAAMKVGS